MTAMTRDVGDYGDSPCLRDRFCLSSIGEKPRLSAVGLWVPIIRRRSRLSDDGDDARCRRFLRFSVPLWSVLAFLDPRKSSFIRGRLLGSDHPPYVSPYR